MGRHAREGRQVAKKGHGHAQIARIGDAQSPLGERENPCGEKFGLRGVEHERDAPRRQVVEQAREPQVGVAEDGNGQGRRPTRAAVEEESNPRAAHADAKVVRPPVEAPVGDVVFAWLSRLHVNGRVGRERQAIRGEAKGAGQATGGQWPQAEEGGEDEANEGRRHADARGQTGQASLPHTGAIGASHRATRLVEITDAKGGRAQRSRRSIEKVPSCYF